nr:hypothetical protein [Candidatus Dormibacteraeota bacterium]
MWLSRGWQISGVLTDRRTGAQIPLIAEALSPRFGSRERGQVVRRLADEEHAGPDGQPRRLSRHSGPLDSRQHGLAGLRDRPRFDAGTVRRHPELIEEAVRLRQEQPARSA